MQYISVVVGAVLCIIFMPLVFCLRYENTKKIKAGLNRTVNIMLTVVGFLLFGFLLAEYLNYLATPIYNPILSIITTISAIRLTYSLFYPLEAIGGLFCGSWITFVTKT